MSNLTGRNGMLADSESAELEQAVDRFEEAWQRGERPALEAYLQGGGPRGLLVELIHVELEYRLKAGEPARAEEYLRRYPELSTDRPFVVDLLAAEYQHRQRQEPSLTLDDYVRRFPGHCDELTSLIVPARGPLPPSARMPGGLPGRVTTISHYQVGKLHAQGGLGAILIGREENLHREVALKLLQAPRARNPESRGRFLREAEITSQLEHPGVVPVYGLGQLADGTPVYAMRFIQGESLQEAVRQFHQPEQQCPARDKQGLAFRQLLSRFVSVCNTIAYAHSRCILHRDLKPGNIMLGAYGETLVVDWGLAKSMAADEAAAASDRQPEAQPTAEQAANTATVMGTVIGTPAYMSPEQAAGRWDLVGPGSDVYSLGATLYVLLTGRAPFLEGDMAEVLRRVQCGQVVPPGQVRKDVPPALEAVCLRAMALRPGDRYSSALGLAADLENWLADEPASAWAEPLRVRLRRWLMRHTALATAATVSVIAAACLVAVTASLMTANDRERHARYLAEADQEKAGTARALAEANQEKERAARRLAQVQLALADRDSYYHHITSADQEWVASNMDRARQRLDECKPELRRWEWHYLRRRCQADLLTLRGHQEVVWGVAFDRDGKRLASASLDGTVKVWDAATGRLLYSRGRSGGPPLWGLAFSPDGKLLAAGGADRAVRLWDATTRKEVRSWTHLSGEVRCLAFSPNGKLLAATVNPVGSDGSPARPGQVVVWETATGRKRYTLRMHAGGVHGVAFRPDGLRLCTGNLDGTVKVWDTVSGNEVQTLEGHRYRVYTVAYSPDNQWLASASGDGTVRIWDAQTGALRFTLGGHQNAVWGVAFSPDSKRLASSSDDQTVRIWDVGWGRLLLILHGHAAGIANVAFHPDGRRVASASDDRTVRIWDASGRRAMSILCEHDGPISGLAVAADSRLLAVAVGSGAKEYAPPASGEIKIWDMRTGRALRTLPGPQGGLAAIALSPDGKLLAATGTDNSVQLWDPHKGTDLARLRGHTGKVLGLGFSPDGRLLASASEDQTVRVWDVAARRQLRTLRGHTGKVRTLVFHPDGRRLISGGEDRLVKVWDLATGSELRSWTGHATSVLTLALSPDGKYLASGSNYAQGVITREPGDIKVWDLRTGKESQTLNGHLHAVTALAFSPDGHRLASGSTDGMVKLWEAETGQEILTLDGPWTAVGSVTFSPDGTRLVSGRQDGSVIIWNGTPDRR
ncbi:MAG TPA: serine/threonine-protein kinase [Gemmataceae bacterium]|nr:serine/threonine-protein kinase [Gemmataceae bacterium]